MRKDKLTAVLTGATSGFGTVIARHLIHKNYRLIFLARSEKKANDLKNALIQEFPKAKVDFLMCDLSSFDSIALACEAVGEKFGQIDLLILNAGVWNFKFQETLDGVEETLQVNLLAPALMLKKLSDFIPRNDRSKVILTASGLHQGTIHYEDLEFRKEFSGFKAYRQSKLGVILLTRLWAKLPTYSGISFFCVHPGVVNTQLGKNANWFSRMIFRLIGSSVEKGARTHLHLIDQPTKTLTSGEYYAKSGIAKASKESYDLQEASELLKTINTYLEPYLE